MRVKGKRMGRGKNICDNINEQPASTEIKSTTNHFDDTLPRTEMLTHPLKKICSIFFDGIKTT